MKKILAAAMLVAVALWMAALQGAEESAMAAQTATATAPAGKEYTFDLGNKAKMTVVRIPAGKFMMGSPRGEKERGVNETQHEVTISKPFYMGQTPVTVDQFAAYLKDSGDESYAEMAGASMAVETKDGKFEEGYTIGASWKKPGFEQKGDHPAVQVCWDDAIDFCKWLSKKSGKKVGLPTEAQWEYACRGGIKTAFPWGDDPNGGKGWANCADQSLKKKFPNQKDLNFFSWDDGFVFTSPVKSFKANGFGLYDMLGNTWQWCNDFYDNYGGASTDPTGPATGVLHVRRGGSWARDLVDCRLARRYFCQSEDIQSDVGFRVAVAAEGLE